MLLENTVEIQSSRNQHRNGRKEGERKKEGRKEGREGGKERGREGGKSSLFVHKTFIYLENYARKKYEITVKTEKNLYSIFSFPWYKINQIDKGKLNSTVS